MKIKHYVIFVIIILIDQLTKLLVVSKNLYTENFGGAFGIGKRYVILILSIMIIIGIIIYLIKNKSNIKNYMPYALILAGGISNLIDRIFRGYVIDFINVNIFNFPNFNIADICITCGICYLVIVLIKEN